MDNDEKLNARRLQILAAMLLGIGGLWYVSLGLNRFYDAHGLAGLPFFWTAVLGICPFVCLSLAALLVEGCWKSRGSSRALIVISLVTAFSPWLWLLWNSH